MGITYSITKFAGITIGVGGTSVDSNISTRSGIVIPLMTKEKDDFFSNLIISIEAGYRQDIESPRIIFGLGSNFGF